MPFSGIKPGSELEQKIDRCMVRVMKRQKRDKGSAIAICRAAIENKETAKSKTDAVKRARYRSAGPSSTKICGTCKFNNNGRCSRFKFRVDREYTCDVWIPNIKALQKRGRTLTAKKADTRGYSARGGQRITGSLYRGQDGKFSSGAGGSSILLNQFNRGLKLNSQSISKLIKAGLITDEGKITPRGKALIKPVKAKPKKGGGKKKPKKGGGKGRGGGGGKKPKKKPNKIKLFIDSLSINDKNIILSLIDGDIPENAQKTITKLINNGFMSKSGKLTKAGIQLFREMSKTAETKAASGSPSSPMAHGPGGLYSTLGLNKGVINAMIGAPKKKRKKKKRTTTHKRSRGGAERRAMFAKMGASGNAYPRSGGKRMSPKQIEKMEMEKFLNSIPDYGGNVEDKILPPAGKAPKGQGKEYQARRWIHGRMTKFEERKAALRSATAGDRGTKRDAQRLSRNKIAIDSINQSLEVARHVIQNLIDAGDNFTDSRELFNDLFSLPAQLLGGL